MELSPVQNGAAITSTLLLAGELAGSQQYALIHLIWHQYARTRI